MALLTLEELGEVSGDTVAKGDTVTWTLLLVKEACRQHAMFLLPPVTEWSLMNSHLRHDREYDCRPEVDGIPGCPRECRQAGRCMISDAVNALIGTERLSELCSKGQLAVQFGATDPGISAISKSVLDLEYVPLLEFALEINRHPSLEDKKHLAGISGLSYRQVKVWSLPTVPKPPQPKRHPRQIKACQALAFERDGGYTAWQLHYPPSGAIYICSFRHCVPLYLQLTSFGSTNIIMGAVHTLLSRGIFHPTAPERRSLRDGLSYIHGIPCISSAVTGAVPNRAVGYEPYDLSKPVDQIPQ
ncbi:hypothetical protein JB92DRAFT_2834456 [Gautieria morchelliformis]|nr:hypothetical protein JB92DRAFT_2834456 [Gautieria morchelliformis]